MSTDELLWYTARASGLVAWALLSAGVLWGLALSTKVLGPRPRPSWMLDLHRFLGGAAVAFVGVHVGAILLDGYTSFGPVEVLVPLTSAWNPTAVAWGIVAMYLLLAVELTSLVRRRLSKRTWHLVHLLSLPLVVISTVHLLTAGTDSGNLVLTGVVLLTAAAIGALTGYRFLGGAAGDAPARSAQGASGSAGSRPRSPAPTGWLQRPPVAPLDRPPTTPGPHWPPPAPSETPSPVPARTSPPAVRH